MGTIRTKTINLTGKFGAKKGNDEEREPTQVWLNVGIPSTHPDTGEELFINLPIGIPLSDLEPQKANGRNESWHQIVGQKNALMEALQKLGDSLEPGEEQLVEGVSIQIRRINVESDVAPVENEVTSSLIGSIGFAKAS